MQVHGRIEGLRRRNCEWCQWRCRRCIGRQEELDRAHFVEEVHNHFARSQLPLRPNRLLCPPTTHDQSTKRANSYTLPSQTPPLDQLHGLTTRLSTTDAHTAGIDYLVVSADRLLERDVCKLTGRRSNNQHNTLRMSVGWST